MTLEARMERKLTAILSADVHGYSRLMGEDELATIRTLTHYREVMGTLIRQYRGRVVDAPGDNLLAEFASVVDAVQCAVAIQQALRQENVALPVPRRMEFRIGINLGDVVIEGERLYGDGVNIAARLESLADPGGVCISGSVYDQVETKLPFAYDYVGEQVVKNITKPVRVYRIVIDGTAASPEIGAARREAPHHGKSSARRPLIALAGLVLLVALVAVLSYLSFYSPPPAEAPSQPASPLPLPDKPSIAVLPFINMSADPQQDYFSDGMSEALITDLSQLSGLFVIARNSVFTYKRRAVQVKEVSRELGVRYVIEGSVQKDASRVRITAQLVDGTTGGHLWAKSYDRELRDIFAVQDEITQQIVAELQIEVQEAERERVRRIPTENLTAYDAVLQGEAYTLRFTKEAAAQARQLFERAIALDPEYAQAYVALGDVSFQEWGWWVAGPQVLEQTLALGQKAVSLDDSLPAAHRLLSLAYLYKRHLEQALAEGERALALDPNDADSYVHQAEVLIHVGRPQEALEFVRKAMRLNPRYPAWYLGELGWAHLALGQYAEAITALKQALLRNANFFPAYCLLTQSYVGQWRSLQTRNPQTLEWAQESAQQAVALSPTNPWAHEVLAQVYLWKRQHEQAIAEAEQSLALNPNDADAYALLAGILSFAGQPEKAIELGEQALRLNSHPPVWYFLDLGRAYALVKRYEEAIAAFTRALADDPQSGAARLSLAAVYSEAGREEDAQVQMVEFYKLSFNLSLAELDQVLVYKDPTHVERARATLRKVGLK